MEYTQTPDGLSMSKAIGKDIFTFAAHNIRMERTGVHANVTILCNNGAKVISLEDDTFNVRRAPERNKMVKSAQEGMGNALQEAYPEIVMREDLRAFCTGLWDAWVSIDPSIDLADIPPRPQSSLFFMEPLLPLHSPTIFFGDGGSCKTYIADTLIAHVASNRPFLGLTAPHQKAVMFSYEDSQESFEFRMGRICTGMGLSKFSSGAISFWPGRGIPFAAQVEGIRKKIERDRPGLLIVDSIGPACDGRPEESEVALAFMRSLQSLGPITILLLAHITKAGEDKKPYGNVYWHNEARRTWYVHRVQEEEASEIDISLTCRKINDGRFPRPIALRLSFDDPEGPVRLARQDIKDVPELQQRRGVREQIWDALTEAKSVQTIAEETGVPVENIDKTLRRHPKRFVRIINYSDGERGRPLNLWGRKAKDFSDKGFSDNKVSDK